MIPNDTFLRQRGMVNQGALGNLRVFLSGSTNGVAELIVLLYQLGAGAGDGQIGFYENDDSITNVFWSLMFPGAEDLNAVVMSHESLFKSIPSGTFDPTLWDIHLNLNGSKVSVQADVFGCVAGARALVSTQAISKPQELCEHHPLSSSLRTATASAMIERMLLQCNIANSVTVSDAWYTLTCRIETLDFEEAKTLVQGINGEVLNMQPTADGLATLARYRLRASPAEPPFSKLKIAPFHTASEPWTLDIGVVEWDAEPCEIDHGWEPLMDETVILGAGGLGSWAGPLLAAELRKGAIHIVDGDDSIELHNLNRQVLYRKEHVGLSKASVAVQQLSKINPNVEFLGYNEFLLPHHLSYDDAEDTDSFDLDEEPSENRLYLPLSKSQIYLACLDNMRTRTLLNEASIEFEAVMINGAGESSNGVVERFNKNEGCMVCRYGRETAYALEVVSCTEEGKRPIASIVTTTAWVGSMMSAYALLEAADLKIPYAQRMEWNRGGVSRLAVAEKPPWINDPCSSHI
tara:strand:+ start:371 stop:1927 length:1557 start_codon:yes stop_codon:yes gene_type:complete